MKKVLLSSLLVASLFGSEYEIGVAGGYININKSAIMHSSHDVNIRIGKYYPYNHIVRLEVEKSVGGDAPDFMQALLNVEHYFNSKNEFQKYLFAGVGYEWIDKYKNSKNSALMGIGAGVRYEINKNISPFIEVRALRKFSNADNYYSTMVGVVYRFGSDLRDDDNDGVLNKEDLCKNTPKGVKVDSFGCAIDSDEDGIVDYKDKCPNTPISVEVDKNGCPVDSDKDGIVDYKDRCPNTPEGVKVDSHGCAVDSDNDGIVDYLDKCNNTPRGIRVDSQGCALDSDGDGVVDYMDQCLETPIGVKVNKNGCPLVYDFKIVFPANQATLTTKDEIKITDFANFLESHPGVKAVIEGYTDTSGSKLDNIRLSRERAKAVYKSLLNFGISKDRLSYKGYGPANPIASNDTPEGRAKNRRVVAKIIYQ